MESHSRDRENHKLLQELGRAVGSDCESTEEEVLPSFLPLCLHDRDLSDLGCSLTLTGNVQYRTLYGMHGARNGC